ncbi:MAG: hypothetical protein JWM68_2985 [Verrucomicrobiales bacterium]|nr:hypothetical protein [Verrucomicrobiales bacterium]
MNNERLNEILKRAEPPQRDAEYWDEFPKQVTREIGRGGSVRTEPARPSHFKMWAGVGFAAACLAATFLVGYWKGQHHSRDFDVAGAKKYFHEVEAMFPNQVRAVIFDERGAHLMLSDKADVPRSSAVFVKICDGNNCQRMLTFSGQQMRWQGETFDVLADDKGQIILSGERSVFSTATQRSHSPRVEGRTFESL